MLGNLGKYELLAVLGTGGQGTVYRARDQALDRMVAVKVVRQDLADDQNYLNALFSEARVAGSLNHPNITIVYDFDVIDGKPYIAMELAQSSLSSRLENGVQMPFQEATPIAVAICGALEHCHANDVIHKDIKPQNILLTSDGQPKLTDFGIARPPESTTRAARHRAGTVTYMSPEQISGTSIDGRSDIYSLGVVLYEMLTGSPPFVGETEYQVLNAHVHEPVPRMSPRLGVPPQLEEIVLKAMEKQPVGRYPDARTMANALESVLSGGTGRKPQVAQPRRRETPATREPRPPQQTAGVGMSSGFPRWLLFGGVGAIVTVAIAIVAVMAIGGTDPESVFPPLAVEFQDWRIRWVELYEEPPYIKEGVFSKGIPIQLPMCGLVTAYGGVGFKGFETSDSVKLGNQEIVLAGGHKLDGSIWTNRGYTVEVRPPTLLGIGSVTKKYNDQLRKFLDLCTQ